eukprot:jgi/Tetstr1/422239/TSEL_013091.t1
MLRQLRRQPHLRHVTPTQLLRGEPRDLASLAAVQNQVQFILCLVKAIATENSADTPLQYVASRGYTRRARAPLLRGEPRDLASLAAVQNHVQFILCLVKAIATENSADTPLQQKHGFWR